MNNIVDFSSFSGYIRARKGMIVLLTQHFNTSFDLLAILCSWFTPEEERRWAIRWARTGEKASEVVVQKYRRLIAIVLNASTCGYEFSDDDIDYINNVLDGIDKQKDLEEVFLLACLIENSIDIYAPPRIDAMIEEVEALNGNFDETGIRVFPHYQPAWDTSKSERRRSFVFNSQFTNYMIVRKEDMSPFEFRAHVLHDEGLFKESENGRCLKIALSPVTDAAVLKCRRTQTDDEDVLLVEGIENEEDVSSRILTMFEQLFYQDYSIIMFPEALGSLQLVEDIQNVMRQQPEIYTFVLLPTICGGKQNILTVLGPGGIKFTEQRKVTPFFMRDEEGVYSREYLEYGNVIRVLISRELGNIVFPICADFLDTSYYHAACDVVMADTVLCPSLSPGNKAFEKQLIKGLSTTMLGVWINSCSAKAISTRHTVPEPVFVVQLPNDDVQDGLHFVNRICGGTCRENYCYIDIEIAHKNNRFVLEREIKFHCA